MSLPSAGVFTVPPDALLYCPLYPYRRVLPHRHGVHDEVDAPQKVQYNTPKKIGRNVLGKLRARARHLYRAGRVRVLQTHPKNATKKNNRATLTN